MWNDDLPAIPSQFSDIALRLSATPELNSWASYSVALHSETEIASMLLSTDGSEILTIAAIEVADDHRSRGLGSYLVSVALRVARNLGMRQVTGIVNRFHPAPDRAADFFRRNNARFINESSLNERPLSEDLRFFWNT